MYIFYIISNRKAGMSVMKIGADIGIDLGTNTVLIYMDNSELVLNEPAVVAADTKTGKLLCAGHEAYKMLGRTHDGIEALYPLTAGVINHYSLTEQMMTYFLKKVCGNKIFMPRVMVCIPSVVTEVEKRALVDAIHHSGARNVTTIEEPVAAALGAGIDISAPYGTMIVDFGGGTTDIAVMSLNGIAISTSIKIAGNHFDAEIMKYVKNKYDLLIGEKTAEQIKNTVGGFMPRDEEIFVEAKGRNVIKGLPESIKITSAEILPIMLDAMQEVIAKIQWVLEQTSPELIVDIFSDGIRLTGGCANIFGIDELIREKTGLKTVIPPKPELCVVIGTGVALKYIDKLDFESHKYRTYEEV